MQLTDTAMLHYCKDKLSLSSFANELKGKEPSLPALFAPSGSLPLAPFVNFISEGKVNSGFYCP